MINDSDESTPEQHHRFVFRGRVLQRRRQGCSLKLNKANERCGVTGSDKFSQRQSVSWRRRRRAVRRIGVVTGYGSTTPMGSQETG
jgi:hypothetical protein